MSLSTKTKLHDSPLRYCNHALHIFACVLVSLRYLWYCITQGAPGRDGIDGTTGRDGIPGTDGKDGRPGSPGVMVSVAYMSVTLKVFTFLHVLV